jgi:hypothetical protein
MIQTTSTGNATCLNSKASKSIAAAAAAAAAGSTLYRLSPYLPLSLSVSRYLDIQYHLLVGCELRNKPIVTQIELYLNARYLRMVIVQQEQLGR